VREADPLHHCGDAHSVQSALADLPRRLRQHALAAGGRLDGTDGLGGRRFDPDKLKTTLFADRAFIADLVIDDLMGACVGWTDPSGSASDPTLKAACDALAGWDRRTGVESAGGMLFTEFWKRAGRIPGVWRVPFDPADPVSTPRDLAATPSVQTALKEALNAAAQQMRSENLALDAPLGAIQVFPDGGGRIPIHGGDTLIGVLNAIGSRYSAEDHGYIPWTGSSFIQVVTFDASGPIADAVLTHSQSSDPASPHATDQTRLYSAGRWVRLPFERNEILRQAVGPVLRLQGDVGHR